MKTNIIIFAVTPIVRCCRLSDASLLFVALILFAGMSGCGSMHNKIETNVSEQYNPQDVTNIYVYTDFVLRDMTPHGLIAKRLHNGLGRALTAQNITYTIDAEGIEMNTESTLSQAVKNNKKYLLKLELSDYATFKCRVSLYDTATRKVVLRSLVQTGHQNMVSPNESPYRLADMIINEIKKKR